MVGATLRANNCATSDLVSLLTETDRLSVTDDGELMVEECWIQDLISEFGSPLYVVSEATLRANFRRVARAFGCVWPGKVQVLYAIKANNNLAIRAIMASEGAGGDCFGLGEMYATFQGGADPAKVVLNGSNKTLEELEEAVQRRVLVNIDHEDEIEILQKIAEQSGAKARVNVRLKVAPKELDSFASDFHATPRWRLAELVRREKWGFSVGAAEAIVRMVLRSNNLSLVGYHVHMGRIGRDPGIQGAWSTAFSEMVVSLFGATGFWPQMLDIGGGWPRERDPESRSLDPNSCRIEEYASAVAHSLLRGLGPANHAVPDLWLEPGRYIVGNAAILVGRAGAIKRDFGLTWVNVDMSTNNLTRIDSAGCLHHILVAVRMHQPYTQVVTIVGPTCTASILGADRGMPDVVRGDPIVVLDAGMYAETTSNQYNGVPRPATVLVNGGGAEVIKERETIEDVFRRHRVPDRLLKTAERARPPVS